MNCWEVLGIEPTEDHQRIQLAYEQQLKFASGEEAEKLDRAFREATGGAPKPEAPQAPVSDQIPESDRTLDANEGQIVREVVIQINALLNDSGRSGMWGSGRQSSVNHLQTRRRCAVKLPVNLSRRFALWLKMGACRHR